MAQAAIQLENLSKRYFLGAGEPVYRTLRDSIMDWVPSPFRRRRQREVAELDARRPLWALKDVSFEVQPGEVVGIVGRNGAGKSTLLKILTRITEPTSGRAVIRGRLSALLEVGTGFHAELSGRENVYFNGSVLGMKKREIDRAFNDIVDFADIGPFLDTPVKCYSSGMAMRLAFAVSAHLEPEILILDEVLAVGDAVFQKKCLAKMHEKARQGRTVLFVSHSLDAIQNLCSQCVYLDKGELVVKGETNAVIERYLEATEGQLFRSLDRRTDRQGNQRISIRKLVLQRGDGSEAATFRSGEDVHVVLGYVVQQASCCPEPVRVFLTVKDVHNNTLFICNNELTDQKLPVHAPAGEIRCFIPRLPLPTGSYRIDLRVDISDELADQVHTAGRFEVESSDYFATGKVLPGYMQSSRFLVPHSWKVGQAA